MMNWEEGIERGMSRKQWKKLKRRKKCRREMGGRRKEIRKGQKL